MSPCLFAFMLLGILFHILVTLGFAVRLFGQWENSKTNGKQKLAHAGVAGVILLQLLRALRPRGRQSSLPTRTRGGSEAFRLAT